MALRNRHTGAGFKPPQAAVEKKHTVVSVEEKAYKEIRQVWIKKVSDKRTNGSAERLTMVSKLGFHHCSKINLEGTCLLSKWHPAYSWHELDSGSFVERRNHPRDDKRKPYK